MMREHGFLPIVRRYLITDPAFYKRALLMIVPVVLQNIVNQGVNMMDTVMVGRLGEISISASSLANQFYMIFSLLCMGISAAGLVLASQYWGAGETKTVKRVYDLCMQLVLITGTVFSLVCTVIPEKIMGFYIQDPEVIREGEKYLRVTALVFLPHGLSLVMSNIVRSVGNTKLGLIISCLSFVVNIGANYVFIFGKLGMPAMGVMGAAIGTLCARVVEFITCTVYMLKIEKKLRYRPSGILKIPSADLCGEFRRLGLPAIISDTILGLAATMVSVVLGKMGRELVSAYTIVNVLDRMCNVSSLGVCSVAGVMIGQTVGSGNIRRAYREGRSFLCMSVGIGIFAAVLVLIAGNLSVDLYKIADNTKEIALSMMRASAIVVFFQAVQSTLSKGILRGGGDTRFLMIADVVFQWCASLPLGYYAGVVLGVAPFWVLLALRIDLLISTTVLLLRLKSGKWIRKVKKIA